MPESWEARLLRELPGRIRSDTYWIARLQEIKRHEISLHLAILVEPFLDFILKGHKTVESRFSKRPVPPFDSVTKGDVLLLKRASGPVVAVCEVGSTWQYNLSPQTLVQLRRHFAKALCAMNPEFWEARAQARFLTLMQVQRVKPIDPFFVGKTDRRGWVVVSRGEPKLPWERL